MSVALMGPGGGNNKIGDYVGWITRYGSNPTYGGNQVNSTYFTLSGNTVTCNKAGKYYIQAMMTWSYLERVRIFIAGTQVFGSTGESTNSPTTYSNTVTLAQDDVIQFISPSNNATATCVLVIAKA